MLDGRLREGEFYNCIRGRDHGSGVVGAAAGAAAESTAQVCLRSMVLKLGLPSSLWSKLVPPSLFLGADSSVELQDHSALVATPLLRFPAASLWVRGLPRLRSADFATNAMTIGVGRSADVNVSPRLLRMAKLLLAEYSQMFNEIKAVQPKR